LFVTLSWPATYTAEARFVAVKIVSMMGAARFDVQFRTSPRACGGGSA
jgi:hypothetical protein